MKTIRKKNGLSGFTSRFESEYDAFGAGHGCNSISAGLGTLYFSSLFHNIILVSWSCSCSFNSHLMFRSYVCGLISCIFHFPS
jgi:hypothetical protein